MYVVLLLTLTHITYRYMDPSCHNFENCLLACFPHQNCLGLLSQLKQLYGENHGGTKNFKSWRERSIYLYVMCFNTRYFYPMLQRGNGNFNKREFALLGIKITFSKWDLGSM